MGFSLGLGGFKTVGDDEGSSVIVPVDTILGFCGSGCFIVGACTAVVFGTSTGFDLAVDASLATADGILVLLLSTFDSVVLNASSANASVTRWLVLVLVCRLSFSDDASNLKPASFLFSKEKSFKAGNLPDSSSTAADRVA